MRDVRTDTDPGQPPSLTRGMGVVRRLQAARSDAAVPAYVEGIGGQRLNEPVIVQIDRLRR